MTDLLVVAAVALAWCLVPVPLAMACGRAFRAGEDADAEPEVAMAYEAAGV